MAKLIKHEMYIKSNIAGNNNKFWEIKLYDDFSVHVRNGRVGGNGQIQPHKTFNSMDSAEAFWDKKVREKTKKGYTKFKGVLSESSEVKVVDKGDLESIALKEIGSSSSEVEKLIRYLSKKNIHNITSSTTITYNEKEGLFKTPLGIVTKEGIDEARDLLNDLGYFVKNNDFNNPTFFGKLEKYLMIIPQKVGRKLIPRDILPDLESVQKQNSILDSLDASLQQIMTASTKDTEKNDTTKEKLFSVKLNVLNDNKEFNRINKKYKNTLSRMHSCSHLRLKKVYTVEIENMKKNFEIHGTKCGNIMELWHGSKCSNLLSILKSGLKIYKGGSHITGSAFGRGLYFASSSSKSLNYSFGYWDGKRENNCFMFLGDVAIGKYYVPKGMWESLPKNGYDSTWAKSHMSGVVNDEFVIYDTSQCNLKYLLEFNIQ